MGLAGLPGPRAAEAGRAFIARPTEPYRCGALKGVEGVWTGWFHGRKEVELGFIRTRDTRERACFRSQTDCRNWLYNLQSEYRLMVWRAECKAGNAAE